MKMKTLAHVPRRLALIAIAILAVLGFGTIGLVMIDHYPWFDAFYMTLITVTTVGFGEIRPLSQAGRVFVSFIILFGATIVLLAIGAMTQTVIELELNQYFGKRRIKGMIDTLENHYIVCGFGRVGRGAAEELVQAGEPFVVIDHSEERVERAMNAGMLAVVGDATRDEVLREMGIHKAKGLVATLSTDADNLFLILSAKALNSDLVFSARIDEETSEEKMRRAGANFVFAPYKSTGHRMAQALIKPHVQGFLDFVSAGVGQNVSTEQVRVSSRSSYSGRTLADVEIQKKLGLIVLGVRKADGTMIFNPRADQTLASGDHVIAMGAEDGLRKLETMLTGSNR
jgi:voltage-gated potassium channel